MKIVNLPAEWLSAGEQLNIVEQAASLCIMAKKLRAKSDELRKRNVLVVRAADAAARRGLHVSMEIFAARMEALDPR